jgi:hypothetical protein
MEFASLALLGKLASQTERASERRFTMKYLKSSPQMISVGLFLLLMFGCAAPATPTALPPTVVPTMSSTTATAQPTAKPSPTLVQMPKGPGVEWRLAIISESSGWGLAQAFAKQIEKDVGVKVVLDDFAIGDLAAGDVLQVLQTGKGSTSRLEELPAALKRADVVVMFGNPMLSVDAATADSINSCFSQSAPTPCDPKSFETYTAHLKGIWAKVIELRAGQPTILRAIDVASPFVNDWKRSKILDACTVCWQCVSNSVRQAAEAYHIPVLSRYDVFNGPKHDQDPADNGYIASDLIHPNGRAQQLAAELLGKLGYVPVLPVK